MQEKEKDFMEKKEQEKNLKESQIQPISDDETSKVSGAGWQKKLRKEK